MPGQTVLLVEILKQSCHKGAAAQCWLLPAACLLSETQQLWPRRSSQAWWAGSSSSSWDRQVNAWRGTHLSARCRLFACCSLSSASSRAVRPCLRRVSLAILRLLPTCKRHRQVHCRRMLKPDAHAPRAPATHWPADGTTATATASCKQHPPVHPTGMHTSTQQQQCDTSTNTIHRPPRAGPAPGARAPAWW